MKTLIASVITCGLTFIAQAESNPKAPYLSLKLEMEHAITKGNQYLAKHQDKEGFWKDKTNPAYAALAITSAMRDPSRGEDTPEHIKKAYTWLLSQQHKDGGIYGKGLHNYNTATALMALAASGDPAHKPAILAARKFIIGLQQDWDKKGKIDSPYDGGIGYGGSYPHSDLSNTYLSIEALKLSEAYAKDTAEEQPELNWEAALSFISRTQNLESTNDQPGIANDGSFVYFPGDSKAGSETLPDGRKALRGYGSMSYAGLLSLIYADLKSDDVRVVAVKKWLNENYTLKENPGLGQQGLYYYYHAMSKALSAAGVDHLTTKDGVKHNWRSDLASIVLSKQKTDGSWVNENARWWENDPILVTTYAVLTLEQIYHSIPEPEKK